MREIGVKKVPSARRDLLLLTLSGVILEVLFGGLLFLYDWQAELLPFLFLSIGAFVPFGFAFFVARGLDGGMDGNSSRVRLVILGFALLFRLTVLPTPPTLSDDIYRYVWEGRVQLNGYNPYRYAPDSAELSSFRDPIYEGVNHKSISAIYPPLSQLVFRLVAAVGGGLVAMKATMVGFDLLVVFALMMLLRTTGRSEAASLVYAWNPLVVIEVAGSGHNDPLALFFLVLGLTFLLRQSHRMGLGAVAAAGLSKVVPFFLLPVLVARRIPWKSWWPVPVLVLLFYFPFMDAGSGLVHAAGEYADRWRHNDFVFGAIVDFLGIFREGRDPQQTLTLAKALLGGSLVLLTGVLIARQADPIRSVALLLGILIACSPTLHPWYVLWVVPWIAFTGSWAWLYLSGSVLLSYTCLLPDETGEARWTLSPWVLWCEFGPWLGLLLLEGGRSVARGGFSGIRIRSTRAEPDSAAE